MMWIIDEEPQEQPKMLNLQEEFDKVIREQNLQIFKNKQLNG